MIGHCDCHLISYLVTASSNPKVGLQFQPSTAGTWRARLNAVFNHTATDSTAVQLLGSAYEHQLQLSTAAAGGEGGHKLYFRPTCIGAQSHRELLMYNPTRVSVGWCWKLSQVLQGAVEVLPQVSLPTDLPGVNLDSINTGHHETLMGSKLRATTTLLQQQAIVTCLVAGCA
jgi:hypothetical protein